MTLVQLKGNEFATSDLLVLMNFVNTNRSLRENETWLPICLPKLNAQGECLLFKNIYFEIRMKILIFEIFILIFKILHILS